jgi:DNA-binding response OmpR family regulator
MTEIAKNEFCWWMTPNCNRFLTQRILTKAGFAVIEADCGQAGLEKALELPDLLTLDGNGLDLVDEFQRVNPAIQVIANLLGVIERMLN